MNKTNIAKSFAVHFTLFFVTTFFICLLPVSGGNIDGNFFSIIWCMLFLSVIPSLLFAIVASLPFRYVVPSVVLSGLLTFFQFHAVVRLFIDTELSETAYLLFVLSIVWIPLLLAIALVSGLISKGVNPRHKQIFFTIVITSAVLVDILFLLS